MSQAYNIERGLISKILETKDIISVKDAQIKVSFFTGEHRRAFQYIYDSVIKTGEVPTVRAFEQKFPNYQLESIEQDGVEIVGNEENIKYWCDELRNKVKHNSLAEAVEEAVKDIEDFDTEKAYKRLKQEIAFIESEVVETNDIDITKNTEDRKQAYLRKKESKGMLGLPYPFGNHLNYITKGMKDETLITIIGNTGVGKTWIEIIIGAYCQLQNCRVLQFVTEMSDEIMRDRYEAMLFSMCYGALNYNSFKSGALSIDQELTFFEFLENDLPNFEQLIITTATGVMGVSAEIEKYDPDIILIDGAYLMEDDQGAKDDWLRVAHITRDLKKLSKRVHKPIVINTQADKNTSKKIGPELDSIMYTQAIGQDSDEVFALYRDEVMRNDNEACIKVLKQREGVLGKVMMNWDFDEMNFSEIYAETTEGFQDDSSDGEVPTMNTIGVH
jgi:replicative DNA helicase